MKKEILKMDNTGKTNKKNEKTVLSIAIPGIILFVCAILFAPPAGVFRTVPFFIAGGAFSAMFCASSSMIFALTAVMTLCTYLASGRGVVQAVFFAAVACLLSASGIYIRRFAELYKKTEKKNVKKKCVRAAITALLVSLVLSAVLCGNAVSFVIMDAENTDYIEYVKENGGADMRKEYTSYEALTGEYRTYVTFEDDGGVYGNADEFGISKKGDVFADDVRDYFEQKLLYTANARLANIVSGATWGFNITASDIALDKSEVLAVSADVDDYSGRISYVVSFDSLINEDEEEKFASVCRDTVAEIDRSGIAFDKIVLCGGNATDVLFCFTVTESTKTTDVENGIEKFDEKIVKPYGVTEMTILDYWKNK